MRRIMLLVTVAVVMAMMVFAAPTFAANPPANGHVCLSPSLGKTPPCGPDNSAAEGIACADIASEGKQPHLVASLCSHPVNNNQP
jgi:hypothetical protein